MSQKKTRNTPNQHQPSSSQAPAAVKNMRLVENTKQAATSSAADVNHLVNEAETQTKQAFRTVERMPEQAERQMEKSFGALKDMTENQQIRWEAVAESCKRAADVQQELQAGLQEELNDLLQEQVKLTQRFLSCRQVNDFVELQNQALKCQINHGIDAAAKLSEAWFRLATDAMEPIQNARAKMHNNWVK